MTKVKKFCPLNGKRLPCSIECGLWSEYSKECSLIYTREIKTIAWLTRERAKKDGVLD